MYVLYTFVYFCIVCIRLYFFVLFLSPPFLYGLSPLFACFFVLLGIVIDVVFYNIKCEPDESVFYLWHFAGLAVFAHVADELSELLVRQLCELLCICCIEDKALNAFFLHSVRPFLSIFRGKGKALACEYSCGIFRRALCRLITRIFFPESLQTS